MEKGLVSGDPTKHTHTCRHCGKGSSESDDLAKNQKL